MTDIDTKMLIYLKVVDIVCAGVNEEDNKKDLLLANDTNPIKRRLKNKVQKAFKELRKQVQSSSEE